MRPCFARTARVHHHRPRAATIRSQCSTVIYAHRAIRTVSGGDTTCANGADLNPLVEAGPAALREDALDDRERASLLLRCHNLRQHHLQPTNQRAARSVRYARASVARVVGSMPAKVPCFVAVRFLIQY